MVLAVEVHPVLLLTGIGILLTAIWFAWNHNSDERRHKDNQEMAGEQTGHLKTIADHTSPDTPMPLAPMSDDEKQKLLDTIANEPQLFVVNYAGTVERPQGGTTYHAIKVTWNPSRNVSVRIAEVGFAQYENLKLPELKPYLIERLRNDSFKELLIQVDDMSKSFTLPVTFNFWIADEYHRKARTFSTSVNIIGAPPKLS